MQNDKGETKSFFVTRIEDGQVTSTATIRSPARLMVR